MAEPRRTFRCEAEIWEPAMTTAEERGEVVSDVLRRCLSAYTRDPDGLLAAVTSPALDGPSVPRFSHAQAAPTPWRWDRPFAYSRPETVSVTSRRRN